jgi:hypothetical protein
MSTRQPAAARAIALRDVVVKSPVVRLGLLLLVISLTSTVVLDVSG